MKKTLIFLLIICGSVQAQSLGINLSVKSHPPNLLYRSWVPDKNSHWPALQGEALFSMNLNSESWQWQVAALYRQTRIVRDYSSWVFPDQVDPYYGFVYQTQDPALADGQWQERYHWIGLKSGFSHVLNPSNRKHQFQVNMGLQVHLPLKATYNFGDNSTDIYSSNDIMELAFYGVYLRPVYQLKLGRNGQSPWAINLFADVDILLRNQADNNPHFSAGGGLGCTYSFKK